MKNIYRPVVSDFNGGGTIVISNSDMLTITGSVTGTTAFETAGGFGGESGIAQAGHTYITAPNSNENSEEGNGSLIAITDSTGNSVTTINAGSFSAKVVIPTKTNKSTVMIAKYNGDELKKIRIYSANVSNNWAKIKEGVKKEINPFINGFVGSRKARVVKNSEYYILRPTVVGVDSGRVYNLGDDLKCASIIIL